MAAAIALRRPRFFAANQPRLPSFIRVAASKGAEKRDAGQN